MTSGLSDEGGPTRISREDVLRVVEYASKQCSLRDYVLIRLLLKTGMRTFETCTLRIEDVDFERCHFNVLDSKSGCLVNVPLDLETVELLRLFIGERREGYVFNHSGTWNYARAEKPWTKGYVWQLVKRIGKQAGVEGLKPRTFRQYFAANWIYKEKGSIVALQCILRHNSLRSTDCYVSKFVFQEDIEAEYRAHMDNVARAVNVELLPPVCRDCGNVTICKYIQEINREIWECMSGCKFKVLNQKPIDALVTSKS
jgi:integrase